MTDADLVINKRFQVRAGGGFSERDASVIGPELLRIAAEAGDVEPESIVDAARPVDAPLHRYFEWNNHIAGQAYRLAQARSMRRSILVEIVRPSAQRLETPASVSVSVAKPAPARQPAESTQPRRGIGAMATTALQNWQRRYAPLRFRPDFPVRLGLVMAYIDYLAELPDAEVAVLHGVDTTLATPANGMPAEEKPS